MIVEGKLDCKVDVPDLSMKRAVRDYLCEKFDLPIDFVVSNGNVMTVEEISAGSHSYIDKTKVREATDIDVAVGLILQNLGFGSGQGVG